jgi:hypothetical protein
MAGGPIGQRDSTLSGTGRALRHGVESISGARPSSRRAVSRSRYCTSFVTRPSRISNKLAPCVRIRATSRPLDLPRALNRKSTKMRAPPSSRYSSAATFQSFQAVRKSRCPSRRRAWPAKVPGVGPSASTYSISGAGYSVMTFRQHLLGGPGPERGWLQPRRRRVRRLDLAARATARTLGRRRRDDRVLRVLVGGLAVRAGRLGAADGPRAAPGAYEPDRHRPVPRLAVRPARTGVRAASYLLVKGRRTFLNLESGGAECYPRYARARPGTLGCCAVGRVIARRGAVACTRARTRAASPWSTPVTRTCVTHSRVTGASSARSAAATCRRTPTCRRGASTRRAWPGRWSCPRTAARCCWANSTTQRRGGRVSDDSARRGSCGATPPIRPRR